MYTTEHEIKTMIDTSRTALYLNVTETDNWDLKYTTKGVISVFSNVDLQFEQLIFKIGDKCNSSIFFSL
jgi:hypothetical protein